jgi:pimeloyl-ACP methyl ester carboxylesterase
VNPSEELLVAFARDEGLSQDERGRVRRRTFELASGRHLSALQWGDGDPEVVFLHGRGQNAHTWNRCIRALGRPALAVDLPGHGHSDWREDHDYGPWPNAEDVAQVLRDAAPAARLLVGMSLGGNTAIRLGGRFPELVRRTVVIDTTPASRDGRPALTPDQQGAVALLEGPRSFATFEEMFEATLRVAPGRDPEALRVGVLRNSRRLADGRWEWRYDSERPAAGPTPADRTLVWGDLELITGPVMLIRSGRSGRVADDDVAEFLRRSPRARVELVADAGHSVQSDRPELLASLLEEFLETTD